ncbi:hypothetical protein CF326_g6831 [Tilletia indica]|nr:hypothetical protein CF326_g6831 [Tilletia indica]
MTDLNKPMPTTRSQQQLRGEPLNMPNNPDNTPASVAGEAIEDLGRPNDFRDAAEDASVTQAAVAGRDNAIQRTLDRLMERLDEMDHRTSALEAVRDPSEDDARVLAEEPASRASQATRAENLLAPSHSTPPARGLPPHMRSAQQTASPSSPFLKDMPRAREAYRTIPTAHKDIFRTVLTRLGTSIPELFDGLVDEDVPEVGASTAAATEPTRTVVAETSDTSSPSVAPPRIRQCKPDHLPKFNGNPNGLEKYLTRLGDLIRSDPDPAWERAVLRAAPIQLTDDAEEWHSGLTTAEVHAIDSFDALEEAMRLHFPVNWLEQRRQAQERKWDPTAELAGTYYFVKLRLLRVVYGQDHKESLLVQDIADGFPATFRVLLRLPRKGALLSDLRAELAEWEPQWREIHPEFDLRSSTPVGVAAPKPSVSAKTTPAKATPAPSAVVPVVPAATAPRPLPLSATYDKARVIPAANGQPRKYRRPGDETLISLNRPCTKCGQDHFNFEHQHLVPAVQTLEVDDDLTYPEVSEDTDEGF